jgi:hypothetical protein
MICNNWRGGIMLLSIPGKILTTIILVRLKAALDKTLRDEQEGFRICMDHIATMCIITEQSLDWQTHPPPFTPSLLTFRKYSTASTEMSSES